MTRTPRPSPCRACRAVCPVSTPSPTCATRRTTTTSWRPRKRRGWWWCTAPALSCRPVCPARPPCPLCLPYLCPPTCWPGTAPCRPPSACTTHPFSRQLYEPQPLHHYPLSSHPVSDLSHQRWTWSLHGLVPTCCPPHEARSPPLTSPRRATASLGVLVHDPPRLLPRCHSHSIDKTIDYHFDWPPRFKKINQEAKTSTIVLSRTRNMKVKSIDTAKAQRHGPEYPGWDWNK